MGTTHFRGNLDVGGDLTVGDSGVLRLPSSESAPSSPTVGDSYYNSTTGKVMMYQDSGWTNVDGSAAASLDAAYNGGNEVTVDGSAVTLTDSLTDTTGTLLITKGGAVTGSDSADVLYVNSTGAHDTSGSVRLLRLLMGSESATTPVGAYITMNANGDDAIKITKGAVTLDDGALTLTSGALTMSSGNLTLTSGNLTMTGTLAVTGAMTISSSITAEGAIIIDADAAEAFLVRENGDGGDTFVVDTSAGAGDTTVAITGAAETITGKTVNVTGSITTGNVVEINADAVTTGNALLISVASNVMTSAGAAISVVDSANADREVFAVRDDGSVYMYGTAEGTTATQTVAGDMVITDGDLTVSGGEVAFTSDSTTAGLVIVNNTITTAASLVDISSTSITTGAMMRINANTTEHDGEILELINAGDAASTGTGLSITMPDITTGAAKGISVVMAGATTSAKGISVTMDAITTGDMLYLDAGTSSLTSGFYINCNDDDTSDFTVGNHGATIIKGDAAGTDAFTITAGDILLNDSDENVIESEDGATTTLLIDNKAGAVGSGCAVLKVDAGGVVDAAGYGIYATFTGAAAAGATVIGVVPDAGSYGIKIAASGVATNNALHVDADPTAVSAVYFLSQGALAADKATLEVASNVATCNADSSVIRVTQDATDGVAFCMTLVQDDVSEPFINFESVEGSGSSVDETNGTEGTAAGFLRIAVNGTDRYLSYYSAPTA